MIKQFIFGLTPAARFWDVNDLMHQPTGEVIIVNDDDGNPVEAPVHWGGSTSVGDVIDGWVFALFFSTEAGVAALHALDGQPVIEVGILGENWPELDEPLGIEQFIEINGWLEAHGLTSLAPGATQHEAIDLVGLYFQQNFDEMNYMPG